MKFRNEYAFLSNFAPCKLKINGLCFTSVEAAFQSFKSLDPNVRAKFQYMTPGQAKAAGRKIKNLRPDWNEIKLELMLELVRIKFRNHPEYAKRLKNIDIPIVEDNDWNDRFWGVCRGQGENWLGKILMVIRKELNDREA